MAMITLKEYAERHGKNPVIVRQKAIRGGFQTARKFGRDWIIDEDEPYVDNRVTSGKYVGTRHKKKEDSMKQYKVKREYYDQWGVYEGNDIVTADEINRLAFEWEMSVEALLEQVEPVERH